MKKFLFILWTVSVIGLALAAWQADATTYDHAYNGGTSVTGVDPSWCYAQSFTTTAAWDLYRAGFTVNNVSGTATGNIRAELYSATSGLPSGSALATSDTIDVSTLRQYNSTQGSTLTYFTFSTPYALTASTEYAIALRFVTGGSGEIRANLDSASGIAGNYSYSNGCSSWTEVETGDLNFFVIGSDTSSGGGSSTTTTSTVTIVQNPTLDIALGIFMAMFMIFGLVFFFVKR